MKIKITTKEIHTVNYEVDIPDEEIPQNLTEKDVTKLFSKAIDLVNTDSENEQVTIINDEYSHTLDPEDGWNVQCNNFQWTVVGGIGEFFVFNKNFDNFIQHLTWKNININLTLKEIKDFINTLSDEQLQQSAIVIDHSGDLMPIKSIGMMNDDSIIDENHLVLVGDGDNFSLDDINLTILVQSKENKMMSLKISGNIKAKEQIIHYIDSEIKTKVINFTELYNKCINYIFHPHVGSKIFTDKVREWLVKNLKDIINETIKNNHYVIVRYKNTIQEEQIIFPFGTDVTVDNVD